MSNKIAPFNSIISPGFWQKFSDIILDRKEVSELPIWGYYGPSSIQHSIFSVDHTSFNDSPSIYHNQVSVKGKIILTSSIQKFKEIDKNKLIEEEIETTIDEPSKLAKFIILTYADLKSYTFTYWFGFPAMSSINISYSDPQIVPDSFYESFSKYKEIWTSGFFLINTQINSIKPLLDETQSNDEIFGYLEPSGIPNVPGWVIRNLAAHILRTRNLKTGDEVRVLSLIPSKNDFSQSRFYTLKLTFSDDWSLHPLVLGWERNGDKLRPKRVDLKSNLDPVTLSHSFVDFNLKLMKWRLFPEFDLDMMHELKVTILGAGTLGCNVARTLLGWGVRNIEFVDSGTVSYSNPVRQSLFSYKDAGKPKAETAASNLLSIFPSTNAVGHSIHIPMPGHPTSPSTILSTTSDFKKLEEIIVRSDVIFLLTDTRESRWAPTMLGSYYNKLVINAALGFESYVVVRHGREHEDLGCYFCTDVVVPGDSTLDRTLDQQCTVTRPGLSPIAGSLAVELMTSVIHFDKQFSNLPTLGLPPHSLRGWLSSSTHISPSFSKFNKCSACSPNVLDGYRRDGVEMVVKVLSEKGYLEKLSGLDKLQEGLEGIVELDDLESD